MQARKIIISVAGVVLFLFAGALTMFFLPSENPQEKPPQKSQSQPEAKPQQEPPTQEKPSAPEMMFVYVTGEVKQQGVYKFPKGSRIYQAIEAAGGFKKTADSAALNLADFLEDKMHIHVNTLGASSAKKPSAQGARVSATPKTRPAAGGLININTATEQELQTLKGIGPSLSKRIVDYRQKNGAFSSPEELINVKGIGAKTLEKFRSQITVR